MRQNRPATRLTILFAVLAALTLGFHLLGSNETFAFEWSLVWLDQADPEIALASLLRRAGLVCCYWALITTALYALSQAGGWTPRPIRLMTIPPIRRLVDRSLATTLAISTFAMPAQALATGEDSPPAIVLEIHEDGIPVPHLQLEPAAAWSSPAVVATEALPGEDNYTVAPGDNLWLIAEIQVRAATGNAPTEQMIAAYWRKLIEANRASLRSGDPNLIYAGEILTLPNPARQP